ncbi:hypothetical protein HCN44_005729 [Aphidius gifuensis]|uniref:F-box domain-containing protein n=1 Tax=Aphidius gifuensis TaxID=684658 RepID=A0A834XUW3_APHGI|nr:F-box/LRR-repeat protein 14-like [Aphidius gifuensis]XP_044008700.1 F-box/LRR-repeat protein 14-like [Aphidius gifuensis]KAF7992948.1 hypothetical protein HCN44_005729 [Aphidius gifuensis]
MSRKKICKLSVETSINFELKKNISIPVLNNDCLKYIFAYLSIEDRLRMEEVCKTWRDASKHTWCDIKIYNSFDSKFIGDNFKHNPKQFQVKKLLTRCGIYLTSLSLNWNYDSRIMSAIREHCHNVIELKLHLNNYNDNNFFGAFDKMDKLKTIEIYDYKVDSHVIYSNGILKYLPKTIEHILLSPRVNGLHVAPNIAMTILKFTNLRSLKLQNLELDNNLMNAMTQSQNLTHLDLKGSTLLGKKTWLKNLTNLKIINLTFIQNIDDNFMISLQNNCKKLTKIDLSYCRYISNFGLSQLGHLENLEKILLNGVDKVDNSIITKLQNLKSLECIYCQNVTDKSIIKILNNSPNLEYLNIFKTGITSETLNCLSDVMKKRGNNINLNIFVDENIASSFINIGDKISPNLFILKY